ncbi:hypothetical protein P171DRAFT_49366 [Karstenula rhodostoma CBS 690.94]|uniref:Uncharacterized protein n=1 Tax=Karstenula rhodostoma CBS 690.94 TaxID=1392251 RepID=A0A9P4UAZ7_9PLEO|nr:hypothetical protein P171DRAFT_49366 [Karstenula rhodostoma CBS 690.94]
MAGTLSATAKGKARTDDGGAPSSSAVSPPRTPPRRPQPPAQPATPSSSAFPATPSSKHKQSRITSFFPNRKRRLDTIPFELSPAEKRAEKRAKKQEEADVKVLIKDIEKEEREAKRAEIEAERQLKREEQVAAALERQKKARIRANWNSWCERNARPNSKFEIPKADEKRLWKLHRSMTQCDKEFGLKRLELHCLEHCSRPNWHTDGATEMLLYRLDDVERLAWRKEAMLAGVECDNEEELFAKGRSLFLQKQIAKTASKEASTIQADP